MGQLICGEGRWEGKRHYIDAEEVRRDGGGCAILDGDSFRMPRLDTLFQAF